jgi:hypothetical protein
MAQNFRLSFSRWHFLDFVCEAVHSSIRDPEVAVAEIFAWIRSAESWAKFSLLFLRVSAMCLSAKIRLCAALVLALLAQKVGSARQHKQLTVACPEETDLAYISCENMHVATDGLNIFRQKFLRFLDAAYCQSRAAVMPKFRTVVGANDWIEFTDVFDIKPFANYLYTKYNIHAVLSDCVPPNLDAAPHKRDCAPGQSNSLAVMRPPVSTEYTQYYILKSF